MTLGLISYNIRVYEKQYYTDETEKKVDDIILSYKSNKITKQNAIDKIMKLDNLELVGIDEHNIDEVVDDTFYDKVSA